MSHLEQRLENDLTNIRNRVKEQAVLVEAALKNAVHALQNGDKPLANQTVLNDHPINRNMRAIDRLCHSFIAVHLPSSSHLRLLSSVIRVNIELERIGDYAVTIAREGLQMSEPPKGVMARELERMAAETTLMLGQSIKAFNELNAEMAASTKVIADQMEANLDSLYAELMSGTQKEQIKDVFAIFVIFTQLKRVADQAKNLCEDTVFAVTGDQKAPKTYNVLFVDEDNSLYSQMAEAVAGRSFPHSGSYRSAGRTPAAEVDTRLAQFLSDRGLGMNGDEVSGIADITKPELTDTQVIVSLQGPVTSYFSEIPFHTASLEWDLSSVSAGGPDLDVEALYREIAMRVKDLMELLRGDEAN